MQTNPTPAEIAALERRIAEDVMGWKDDATKSGHPFGGRVVHPETRKSWSPWNNPADALEVLERLDIGSGYVILKKDNEFRVTVWGVGTAATAPGPHFGPAVMALAEKVMEESK